MDRLDIIKNLTHEQAGQFLCDALDLLNETDDCDHCPVRKLCEVGHNGWRKFLESKPSKWEVDHYGRIES